MKIGELSRRTGVPTRMLRYYEEQGLLRPERADNGYRSYRAPRPSTECSRSGGFSTPASPPRSSAGFCPSWTIRTGSTCPRNA